MEKRTPHCKLAVVKNLVAACKVRAIVSALAGGAALGFGFEELIGAVVALTPRDFYEGSGVILNGEGSRERRVRFLVALRRVPRDTFPQFRTDPLPKT
jgi:hypothetical protein